MDLGVKYSGQGSYAQPLDTVKPPVDLSFTTRNLCEGFGDYSKSNSIATSWATAVIIAAEASLQANKIEDTLSLNYVLSCLPKYCDVEPNNVTNYDIIRFVTEEGLMSEADASALSGDDLCSDTSSKRYYFEIKQNDVPNMSGLKKFVAEKDPVIVLLALDLFRLRTANNVTGQFVYTGATYDPSLFAVIRGYDEDKWNVTFNVVPCENVVLQLPITESETNANYAGIAGFAFSMSFSEISTPISTDMVEVNIGVHYGSNPVYSGKLQLLGATNDEELLSIPLTAENNEFETSVVVPHLIKLNIADLTGASWNDESYISISINKESPVDYLLKDISSDYLYYHSTYGRISETRVDVCNNLAQALRESKIVNILDGVCVDSSSFSSGVYDNVVYLIIGNNNFNQATNFQINNYPNLEYLKIGDNSFTNSAGGGRRLGDPKSVLQIYNCQKLTSIEIGRYSFSNYEKLTLSSLPLLENLTIGSIEQESNNFLTAPFLLLDLLNKNQTISSLLHSLLDVSIIYK